LIFGSEIAHVTRDSDTTFKVKGQGHQAALLRAALTHKAAAAISVGTYSAWESTATLRLLGGAQGAGVPTGGGEGRSHVCRHAHSLLRNELFSHVPCQYYVCPKCAEIVHESLNVVRQVYYSLYFL